MEEVIRTKEVAAGRGLLVVVTTRPRTFTVTESVAEPVLLVQLIV